MTRCERREEDKKADLAADRLDAMEAVCSARKDAPRERTPRLGPPGSGGLGREGIDWLSGGEQRQHVLLLGNP